MALSDYRLCDVCGGKAFYDANLNYSDGGQMPDVLPYRQAGKEQFENAEHLQKWAHRLDYVGDWAVICTDCAKTHRCVIVPATGTGHNDSGESS